MFLLTGTPGVGKSTVADLLAAEGHFIVRAKETTQEYILLQSDDDTVIDADAWAAEFTPVKGIVEGHFAHFIPNAKGVIVLRCRPDVLAKRLAARGYSESKVMENVEAEILDVILIETLNIYAEEQVYEIDVSDASVKDIASQIQAVVEGRAFPCCGIVDWTEWL
jgi:adenylate kinase